jgi:hypothetical protein
VGHKNGSAQGYNGQQGDEKLFHNSSIKREYSASGTPGLHAKEQNGSMAKVNLPPMASGAKAQSGKSSGDIPSSFGRTQGSHVRQLLTL